MHEEALHMHHEYDNEIVGWLITFIIVIIKYCFLFYIG